MTRKLLLQKICPNACINDCRFIGCSQCNEKLNEWLDEYDNQIRADVIDEFAKKLIQTVTSMTTGFRVVGNIERIAKELKGSINDIYGIYYRG